MEIVYIEPIPEKWFVNITDERLCRPFPFSYYHLANGLKEKFHKLKILESSNWSDEDGPDLRFYLATEQDALEFVKICNTFLEDK